MKLALIALASLVSSAALAIPQFPLPERAANVKKSAVNNPALFEGIVKLNNCSGSVIQFEGQKDSAKAIMLTNGHCIAKQGGYLNPGEVWVNVPKVRVADIYTKTMVLKNAMTTKILYATMTNTDIALYEMNKTYAEIKNEYGIRPLLLSPNRPVGTEKINIPSGFHDRNWACNLEGHVHILREGNWTFTDSIRYNQECNTIGGTSGSPIVEDGTRTVIGINNTGNEDGERCTLMNPCEVDERGQVTVQRKRSYGQQTYNIYGCMDANFKLDLSLASCELPKP